MDTAYYYLALSGILTVLLRAPYILARAITWGYSYLFEQLPWRIPQRTARASAVGVEITTSPPQHGGNLTRICRCCLSGAVFGDGSQLLINHHVGRSLFCCQTGSCRSLYPSRALSTYARLSGFMGCYIDDRNSVTLIYVIFKRVNNNTGWYLSSQCYCIESTNKATNLSLIGSFSHRFANLFNSE